MLQRLEATGGSTDTHHGNGNARFVRIVLLGGHVSRVHSFAVDGFCQRCNQRRCPRTRTPKRMLSLLPAEFAGRTAQVRRRAAALQRGWSSRSRRTEWQYAPIVSTSPHATATVLLEC